MGNTHERTNFRQQRMCAPPPDCYLHAPRTRELKKKGGVGNQLHFRWKNERSGELRGLRGLNHAIAHMLQMQLFREVEEQENKRCCCCCRVQETAPLTTRARFLVPKKGKKCTGTRTTKIAPNQVFSRPTRMMLPN